MELVEEGIALVFNMTKNCLTIFFETLYTKNNKTHTPHTKKHSVFYYLMLSDSFLFF